MSVCLNEFMEFYISEDHDIIDAIINSNHRRITALLAEDPSCINAVHEVSGMNAMMLAVYGNMEGTVDKFLEHAHLLDFSHREKYGEDLMLVAMGAHSDHNMRAVFDAYEAHAVHLLNNFDENAL